MFQFLNAIWISDSKKSGIQIYLVFGRLEFWLGTPLYFNFQIAGPRKQQPACQLHEWLGMTTRVSTHLQPSPSYL